MSLWKKLFGGGDATAASEPPLDAVEYQGFVIRPAPFVEGGQYQTCGIITRQIGDETKEHRFIRADRFVSKEDAVEVTLRKARQLIDEQGERIFR